MRRGYKYMHAGRLVTLFSARNYFGREENDAALLLVARDGYGQIRVRPKRLPAYVSGAHPSLGSTNTSQRRRRSRSGSPKRRRSRSSSPYTSDDEPDDVATTAGALDAAFAETPPPPPPKGHFAPSPKVHSSLGL